jgi:co-chaperonin GroES (HSP10)
MSNTNAEQKQGVSEETLFKPFFDYLLLVPDRRESGPITRGGIVVEVTGHGNQSDAKRFKVVGLGANVPEDLGVKVGDYVVVELRALVHYSTIDGNAYVLAKAAFVVGVDATLPVPVQLGHIDIPAPAGTAQ